MSVDRVRFADGFDRPDRLAFGLGGAQLGVVVLGLAGGYLLIHAPVPGLLAYPAATLLVIATSGIGWGHWRGRPVLDWVVAGARFLWRRRTRLPHLATANAEHVLEGGSGDGPPVGRQEQQPATANTVEPPGSGEPPWAQWLTVGQTPTAPPAPPGGDEGSIIFRDEAAAATAPPARSESSRPADNGLELGRTPLVLLPSAEPTDEPEGRDGDEIDLPDDAPPVVPIGRQTGWLADHREQRFEVVAGARPGDDRAGAPPPAPIFLGAPRRIAFFSLNGGTGRTTLATEVACLLAARGRLRAAADEPEKRLRVALLDLDLQSATVSMRLGIPGPTVADYLRSAPDHAASLDDYLVTHSSGVRALLGPPKPMAGSGGPLTAERVAALIAQVEREGANFVFIDTSGEINEVTSAALNAAHDVYIVLTDAARGVQDAYRTTEALRRLGVGHKLSYVVNRSRGHVDFGDTMADLRGRIIATVPYDVGVEEAENRHRVAALRSRGGASQAFGELAAHIYPGLDSPHRRRKLPRFTWLRDAR